MQKKKLIVKTEQKPKTKNEKIIHLFNAIRSMSNAGILITCCIIYIIMAIVGFSLIDPLQITNENVAQLIDIQLSRQNSLFAFSFLLLFIGLWRNWIDENHITPQGKYKIER